MTFKANEESEELVSTSSYYSTDVSKTAVQVDYRPASSFNRQNRSTVSPIGLGQNRPTLINNYYTGLSYFSTSGFINSFKSSLLCEESGWSNLTVYPTDQGSLPIK
jgi:hypothetical protein